MGDEDTDRYNANHDDRYIEAEDHEKVLSFPYQIPLVAAGHNIRIYLLLNSAGLIRLLRSIVISVVTSFCDQLIRNTV